MGRPSILVVKYLVPILALAYIVFFPGLPKRTHPTTSPTVNDIHFDGDAAIYHLIPDDSHDLHQFLLRSQPHILHTPIIITKPNDNYDREDATFVVVCRNEEIYDILQTIQITQDRFNHRYNYDWVFLNDKQFDVHFMHTVAQFIPKGMVKFGQIPPEHWSYPPWINQTVAAQERQRMDDLGVVYAQSESYRHMCRYFLGFFYKHPLVEQYRYYWRLEPGIKLFCDINYDVFRFMRHNQLMYGFTLSMFEYNQTIPTLWSRVKQYMAENDVNPDPDLLQFVQNDDESKSYNLCHFWSNFEVADFLVFRSDNYQKFFDFLDSTGGFYYERWGDAPVHTIGISMFQKPQDIWWFHDIGYYHLPYTQCPTDVTTHTNNRCSCDPASDFSFSFLSCTAHMLSILQLATDPI